MRKKDDDNLADLGDLQRQIVQIVWGQTRR
jgi:hypothetical protein